MTEVSPEPEVRDNPAAARFEILEGSERNEGGLGNQPPATSLDVVGFADYELAEGGGTIAFVHTETDPAHGGKGLAKRLVSFALDDARRRGLGVLPFCPYVRKVIAENPDAYLDLVPAGRRAEFGLPSGD